MFDQDKSALVKKRLIDYGIGINDPVRAAIIASGSGTTAEIYLLGVQCGMILGVDVKVLISTKEGAGCIDMAKKLGIATEVVNRKDFNEQITFNNKLAQTIREYEVELIFLAGCNQEVYPISGVYIINNHPAPPDSDGGKGMYDFMPHKHVLLRIKDEIKRHPHRINKVYRTCICNHEAFPRDASKEGMDTGEALTTVFVDIPHHIIRDLMATENEESLKAIAKALQRHVMRHEYLAIFSNAMLAAQRVRDAKYFDITLPGFNDQA